MFLEVKKTPKKHSLPETMSKRIRLHSLHTPRSRRAEFISECIILSATVRELSATFLGNGKNWNKNTVFGLRARIWFEMILCSCLQTWTMIFIVSLLLPTTIQIDTI